MSALFRLARRFCCALSGAAAIAVVPAAVAGPAEPSAVQTLVHAIDGHRLTVDVYPPVGALR